MQSRKADEVYRGLLALETEEEALAVLEVPPR